MSWWGLASAVGATIGVAIGLVVADALRPLFGSVLADAVQSRPNAPRIVWSSALEVRNDGHFEFNALHYTDEDLAAAHHTPELTPRPEVVLHLDHGMRGLGTGLGMDTLPEYRLDASEYRFTFDLKLI